MEVEIWTSKTFDDQIRLCHTENLWKGIGEGFGFERGTRIEAVLLLRSWEYELVHHSLPGDNKKYHKKEVCHDR